MQAFLAEDAGAHLAAVVERRIGVQQVDPAAGGSAFRVRAAEDHALRPAVDDGAGAHRTGLLGDVECAFFEPPIAESLLRRGEREHFRMGSGVLEGFHLIPCPGNDAAFAHDHGPHGHFAGGIGLAGFPQCLAHEMGIAVQIDDGEFVFHAGRVADAGEACTRIAKNPYAPPVHPRVGIEGIAGFSEMPSSPRMESFRNNGSS